jgi:hypothetical protein
LSVFQVQDALAPGFSWFFKLLCQLCDFSKMARYGQMKGKTRSRGLDFRYQRKVGSVFSFLIMMRRAWVAFSVI